MKKTTTNHLLLTSASSVSVMFLTTSPGKVTKTDLTGRLHPFCTPIPKSKHTTNAQPPIMRSTVAQNATNFKTNFKIRILSVN